MFRELLTLSKQRMASRSFLSTTIFIVGHFVFLSSKDLHIQSQKYKHLTDHRLGPFEDIEKVGMKSYKHKLPPRCRIHPVFYCDLLYKSSNPTPSRHQPVEIESDQPQ